MKKQKLFFSDTNNGITSTPGESQDENNRPTNDENEEQRNLESASAFMLGALMGGRDLHRRPGITIGNMFFSLECILMVAMVALMAGVLVKIHE